jgi:hypothetical protein
MKFVNTRDGKMMVTGQEKGKGVIFIRKSKVR